MKKIERRCGEGTYFVCDTDESGIPTALRLSISEGQAGGNIHVALDLTDNEISFVYVCDAEERALHRHAKEPWLARDSLSDKPILADVSYDNLMIMAAG